MERFIEAIESALESKNWYAALSLALLLPDICGKLQFPAQATGPRYKAWFDKYVCPTYTIGSHVFLGSGDCYALRCSFLHEGGDDITAQRARVALDKFRFTVPDSQGNRRHCNHLDNVLELEVGEFCRDMCKGARVWEVDVAEDNDVQERKSTLLSIQTVNTHPFSWEPPRFN
ncbi:hypothetical protein IQ268_09100 [Oculatella sp. LEGE 06141]|uniref:hypothetical protein n=1 Tax=Oculatella sp. LEGE 06141 TaxID=1828648 RepID=UPI001881AFB4|nr:hypothetical protein [Oculatella sp. LEGE 06141]MBE9178716.1 hypothetical protein [Oculatella sp. LEGE 06141]